MTNVIREVNSSGIRTAPEAAGPSPKKVKRRWGRRLFLGILLLGGMALFLLPTIAGWMLCSPETLAWISGQPTGTIEIGQANFTWQGPVQLKNVVLQTPDGRPIANVATLTSNQTLWGLLTQQQKTIKLNLDGVHYTVVVPEPGPVKTSGTADVSQLTAAMQKLKVPAPSLPMEVTLTNGRVDFQNPRHETIDSWTGITATYKSSPDTKSIQTLSATVPASQEHQTGELKLEGQWTLEKATHQEAITFRTSADHVSLLAANAWLDKYLGSGHGLTSCTGQIQAAFERNGTVGWKLGANGVLNGKQTPSPSPATGNPQTERLPGQTILQFESEYAKAADELSVPHLQLAADQATVDLQGSIREISGPQILHVLGQLKAPSEALRDLLPVELREQIQIDGMQLSQIEVSGALRPDAQGRAAPLTYSLVAIWDKVLAYGLESDHGKLKIGFREGIVTAEPLDVPVSGGKLLMLPTLDLTTQPPVLHFRAGTMLQDVELTEGVCRDWLMYVSPTLANATSADGRFSLLTNEGTFPLGEIARADVSGVVAIRDGSVRPGPLAVTMLQHVSQVQSMLNRGGDDLAHKAFLTMKQEDVSFRLFQGRVYHENFGANIGEMRLSTAGSMGLDHTLAMTLKIAFPSKWLAADRPVLQALADVPIQLGIAGTLEEPRVDASGLADFGKQLGLKAGVGLIEKLIERRRARGR